MNHILLVAAIGMARTLSPAASAAAEMKRSRERKGATLQPLYAKASQADTPRGLETGS
jgi:hypothetical protein